MFISRFLFFFSLIFISSCSVNHGDFTILTNKIVNTKDFDMGKQVRQRGVYGEDVSHIVVFIPTKVRVTLSEALNNAFEKSDTDVMTDVTVKSWQWYIPYLYGQNGFSVEGDAVKTRMN